MNTIRFFFDPISPYVYLASHRLPQIAKETNCSLEFVPVLFAGILNTLGQKGPAEIPSKREYIFRDALLCAEQMNIPFQGPPTHPYNPLAALRTCVACENVESRNRLATHLIQSCWLHGKELSSLEILKELANNIGLDGKDLIEKSQTQEVKNTLKENTEQAIELGAFGVPTFAYENELFWGNDRLDLMKDFILGKVKPVDEQLNRFLERPSSANRIK